MHSTMNPASTSRPPGVGEANLQQGANRKGDNILYRSLRRIDTGQWVNVLFTVDGDEFSVKATAHRASIAKALGVPRTSLEVVDSATDPRTGALLEMPLPPKPAPTRTEDLLAIPRSDWTTAQMRELIELTARETVL